MTITLVYFPVSNLIPRAFALTKRIAASGNEFVVLPTNTGRDSENVHGIQDLIATREAGFAKIWAQMLNRERKCGIVVMKEVENAGKETVAETTSAA